MSSSKRPRICSEYYRQTKAGSSNTRRENLSKDDVILEEFQCSKRIMFARRSSNGKFSELTDSKPVLLSSYLEKSKPQKKSDPEDPFMKGIDCGREKTANTTDSLDVSRPVDRS